MDKERDFCLKCQEWAFCQLESAWRSSPNTEFPPDCRFAEPQEPEKSVHPVEQLNATIPDNSGSGPVVSISTETQSPTNTPYVPRENHPWRMGTGEERPKREPRKSSVARRKEPHLSIKTAMRVAEDNPSADDLFDRFVRIEQVPDYFHPFIRVVFFEHQAFSATATALRHDKSNTKKRQWHQLIEDAFKEGFPDLDPKRSIELRSQASILAKRAALFE